MSQTTSSQSQERRERARLCYRAPVRVYADPKNAADSFFLESADMSPEGVFLRTDLLFPEGEWLDLEFLVPGQATPVRGRGLVVRVHASCDPPGPGIAVHLPQLGQKERQMLQRLDPRSLRIG